MSGKPRSKGNQSKLVDEDNVFAEIGTIFSEKLRLTEKFSQRDREAGGLRLEV